MKKKILLPVLVLVVVTVILAAVHLGTSPEAAPGELLIQVDGREETYALARQDLTGVSGTLVNGKGEQRLVDAQGMSIAQILSDVLRLVVFGDENSKRNVTDVIQLIVE